VVADRTVLWISGGRDSVAFWTRDSLVVAVFGNSTDIRAAIERLP
jgi:hypothetical protein